MTVISKLSGKAGEIIESYQGGKIMREIADTYGVNAGSILQLLEKHKIPRRPKSNLNGREAEVIRDYQSGLCVDEISKQYRIGRALINEILRVAGITKRYRGDENRRHALNHNYFDVIDTESKAYFLGFLYADGFNGNGKVALTLHPKDREIVEAFRDAIGSNAPFHYREGKSPACGLIVFSRRLSARLTELGCMQAKTFKLTFPEWLAPVLRHHFIRGYFDGDGYISDVDKTRFKGIISILGTQSFTDSLATILADECSVSVHIRPHQRSAGIQYANVRGNHQIKRVIEYLYKDATIYLKRKKDRADAILATDFYKSRGRATRPRLTTEKAREIKELSLAGNSDAKIAGQYGISTHVVYHIRTGRSWVSP